jgi:hypothetical protein
VRDQQLFFPAHRRTRDAIVRRRTELDPAYVNRRVVDLLKNPQRWRDAHLAELDYPLAKHLAAAKVPVMAAAASTSPLFDVAQQAAAGAKSVGFLKLPDAVAQWGEALDAFLGS